MAKLDVKGVYRCIRNSYGFDEFEAKYGLSEAELRDEIQRLFRKGNQASDMLKQIATNTKKNRRQAKAKSTTEQSAKIVLKDQPVSATYAEGCVILTPPASHDSSLEQSVPEDLQDLPQNIPELLQDLRDKASVLEAEIAELNTEYDKKAAQRDKKSHELKSLDAEIEKIKKILQKRNSEHMRVQLDMDSSAKSMRATAKKRQRATDKLDDIYRQIEGLEIAMKLQINPADGTVSLDDPGVPVEVIRIDVPVGV